MIMSYRLDAALMDFLLLLRDCTDAKTFAKTHRRKDSKKVVAEAAFQEFKLARSGLVTEMATTTTWQLQFGQRLSTNIIGCLRGLRCASHLNYTLGLFISKDPKSPARSLVDLADGHVRSVPDTNFEAMQLGTGRVILHGLTSAAHLNSKHGTLLRLKPGSLERVIV